jgi:hypothetical protein
VLVELRRFLGGERATLLWDGLPSHRSTAMRDWLNRQRRWLVVERLPAYAPELNPVEGLWSCLKAVELANLATPTLGQVITQAHHGIERVRRTPHLAYSFLRHAGLSSHNHHPPGAVKLANPAPIRGTLPGREERRSRGDVGDGVVAGDAKVDPEHANR